MKITQVQAKKTEEYIMITKYQYQAYNTLLQDYIERLELDLQKLESRGKYVDSKREQKRQLEIGQLKSHIEQCLELKKYRG